MLLTNGLLIFSFTGIKPYRCEICQRKFTQLSHLQQHIRTHTGDKPYKCRHPGCNKAFSQLSNLQSHSRCHQTDKPYKCNSCYKCFVDEAALLDHIPKHKESKHLKTHICHYCGKSYTQETYLTKHMQKHTEKAEKKLNRHNKNNNSNNNNNFNNNEATTNGNHHHTNGNLTHTKSYSALCRLSALAILLASHNPTDFSFHLQFCLCFRTFLLHYFDAGHRV